MPMLIILPSLIMVPSRCSSAVLPGSSSLVQAVCEESYLKLLTDEHPVFQRALRISTAIAICQFIQLCLEILPRWRSALAGLGTIKTFLLGGWLLGMNFLGGLWTIEWSARHFGLKITPLSDLTNYQWEIFGMALLVGWILWFLAITCFTLPNVSECDSNKKALCGFFERLKFTFVVGQGIVFFRACVHPHMGFVHAQLELTIINLLLPSIYVVSLICLRMVSLLSVRAVVIDGPLALGISGIVFIGSKMTEKPHVFVVVSLFLFDRFLRSEAASSLSEMGQTLQQMLQETSSDKKHPLLGHSAAKKFVYLALAILLLFVGAISGFSVLSVLQKSAKWFPDATSLKYEDNSIHIHHTGVVKLHLGLANETNPAITVDDPLYASCSNRWNGLSLIDLAFFAEAAYFNPLSNDTAEFISTIFDNELGDIHVHLPALNTKTGSKLDFFEAYIPKLNTSVISVRGTDIWRFTDFVEDVKMFFEPVVFSVLSSIFPTIRIWPDVTFSTLIELYSEMIGLFGLQHESWYYHELLDYVTSRTDRKVVLTGHSMGGGIARLVGARGSLCAKWHHFTTRITSEEEATMNDPLEWYYEIPVVSRLYLTGSFLTTTACALDLVSPFSLYFNFNLIFFKGQVWRLVTNFMFFGLFSLDFLFHMYFVSVRYCRLLEEGSFRGRTADFVYMLLLGAVFMILVAPFVNIHFLGSSLTFMMVYLWGRRNEYVRMSFLGLFPFTAPYLPWVLFSFSILLGNSATTDLIGIIVGHIYYFLEDVYPTIASIRGWKTQRPLATPRIIRYLFDPRPVVVDGEQVINDLGGADVNDHPHAE
ncbi:hypothetical protein JG688_00008832 [Phytophthora aleatoria]|uniref:Fungal lipase-type domain-containing protein n=1 Tax=Phytophthora aleatoria TaxID=2496075 RepID=A0A8J5MFK9_9STRA|nr:hypothetical protein JG688_00008832 [Phytophthora aleatoria]